MRYFKVKNFDKLQPKRNGKNAPWIRLYANWMMDSKMGQLGDTAKAHWIGLLCIAHTEDNQIPYDPIWIKRRGLFNSPVKLETFLELGLIEILGNKSVSKSKQKKPVVREKERVVSIGRIDICDGDEKPSPSGVQQALDFYHKHFLKTFEIKPMIDGGKDGALLKKVINHYGLDTTLELLKKFIESKDEFIKGTGRTIGVFYKVINKLLVGEKPTTSFTKSLKTIAENRENQNDKVNGENLRLGSGDVINVRVEDRGEVASTGMVEFGK